jgi:hypothetical protein
MEILLPTEIDIDTGGFYNIDLTLIIFFNLVIFISFYKVESGLYT